MPVLTNLMTANISWPKLYDLYQTAIVIVFARNFIGNTIVFWEWAYFYHLCRHVYK